MWVGLTQSIEGLNRTKKLSKGELSLLDHLSWNISLILMLELTPLALLVLRPSVRLELHIGSSRFPACKPQILGLPSLHNFVSQFHIFLLLVLFLWRTLTNTPLY